MQHLNRKLKNEELQRISVEMFKKIEKIPIVIVLDNVRSLNNIGSVFRTADAFRIEAIYLCGITASPPHRDIQKTALGATESVSWKHFKSTTEAIKELKKKGFNVLAIEQTENSISLDTLPTNKKEKVAVIFGNEVNGIDQTSIDLSDAVVEIPQYGTKHSLNISVCAGIILWELKKRFLP